jgi:hypothetical protein
VTRRASSWESVSRFGPMAHGALGERVNGNGVAGSENREVVGAGHGSGRVPETGR